MEQDIREMSFQNVLDHILKPAGVKVGGFPDEMFIDLSEEEKEKWTCGICYLIVKDSRQCDNKHLFCHTCVFAWTLTYGENSQKCPMCRCEQQKYLENKELERKLSDKRVKCTETGCAFRAPLKIFLMHSHGKTTYSNAHVDLEALRPARPTGARLLVLPEMAMGGILLGGRNQRAVAIRDQLHEGRRMIQQMMMLLHLEMQLRQQALVSYQEAQNPDARLQRLDEVLALNEQLNEVGSILSTLLSSPMTSNASNASQRLSSRDSTRTLTLGTTRVQAPVDARIRVRIEAAQADSTDDDEDTSSSSSEASVVSRLQRDYFDRNRVVEDNGSTSERRSSNGAAAAAGGARTSQQPTGVSLTMGYGSSDRSDSGAALPRARRRSEIREELMSRALNADSQETQATPRSLDRSTPSRTSPRSTGGLLNRARETPAAAVRPAPNYPPGNTHGSPATLETSIRRVDGAAPRSSSTTTSSTTTPSVLPDPAVGIRPRPSLTLPRLSGSGGNGDIQRPNSVARSLTSRNASEAVAAAAASDDAAETEASGGDAAVAGVRNGSNTFRRVLRGLRRATVASSTGVGLTPVTAPRRSVTDTRPVGGDRAVVDNGAAAQRGAPTGSTTENSRPRPNPSLSSAQTDGDDTANRPAATADSLQPSSIVSDLQGNHVPDVSSSLGAIPRRSSNLPGGVNIVNNAATTQGPGSRRESLASRNSVRSEVVASSLPNGAPLRKQKTTVRSHSQAARPRAAQPGNNRGAQPGRNSSVSPTRRLIRLPSNSRTNAQQHADGNHPGRSSNTVVAQEADKSASVSSATGGTNANSSGSTNSTTPRPTRRSTKLAGARKTPGRLPTTPGQLMRARRRSEISQELMYQRNDDNTNN